MTDGLSDRIKERLSAIRMSASAASVSAGQNAGFIGDILKGKAKNPRSDSMARLADVLECSLEWLMEGDGEPAAPILTERPDVNVRFADVKLPQRTSMLRDIEVRGTAAGSMAGAFQFEGDVVDYVGRPPGLATSKGIYALYVEGYSMVPEHNPGDLRFVSAFKKPNIGDTVIVTAKYTPDGPIESFIKRLVKRSGTDKIVVEQFNPKAQIEFDMRYVVSVHKVLTTNELFGI